jgi:hypothetical protein
MAFFELEELGMEVALATSIRHAKSVVVVVVVELVFVAAGVVAGVVAGPYLPFIS